MQIRHIHAVVVSTSTCVSSYPIIKTLNEARIILIETYKLVGTQNIQITLGFSVQN